MAPLDQLVRIKNDSDEPFTGMFNGQRYLIKSRSETVVPFEAMCLWMGNPNSQDLDAKRRDRTNEYKRLRVKYGVYEHNDRQDQLPKLRAYDMEGEQIITVLDDPEGKNVSPTVSTVQDDEGLRQEVASLRELVKKLLTGDTRNGGTVEGLGGLTEEGSASEENGDYEEEVTEDSPQRVPVG